MSCFALSLGSFAIGQFIGQLGNAKHLSEVIQPGRQLVPKLFRGLALRNTQALLRKENKRFQVLLVFNDRCRWISLIDNWDKFTSHLNIWETQTLHYRQTTANPTITYCNLSLRPTVSCLLFDHFFVMDCLLLRSLCSCWGGWGRWSWCIAQKLLKLIHHRLVRAHTEAEVRQHSFQYRVVELIHAMGFDLAKGSQRLVGANITFAGEAKGQELWKEGTNELPLRSRVGPESVGGGQDQVLMWSCGPRLIKKKATNSSGCQVQGVYVHQAIAKT